MFFCVFPYSKCLPRVSLMACSSSRQSPAALLHCSLSIRPSYGSGGEEILDPFSLPFFPFSPETPDTQATFTVVLHLKYRQMS